ncbi:MAG: hypothetical protein OXF79_26690 [Chloroflexi bacterium]|nr:hypothetical protein [Chloroflexota bacterium]
MLAVPDLPEPGEQSLDDRRQISRRFIIHAREELEKGHRLQAGEKAWGAVVQPLKAIAEQRGWRHQSHRDIHYVGLQILAESPNVDLQDAISEAYRVGHENFYENHRHPEELAEMLDKVEDVMPILESMPEAPPRPFTIASNAQLRRLRSLTGNESLQLGDASAVGFSLKHGSVNE